MQKNVQSTLASFLARAPSNLLILGGPAAMPPFPPLNPLAH